MRVAFGLYVLRVHVWFAMFRPARSEIIRKYANRDDRARSTILITLYSASYPSEDPARTFIHSPCTLKSASFESAAEAHSPPCSSKR